MLARAAEPPGRRRRGRRKWNQDALIPLAEMIFRETRVSPTATRVRNDVGNLGSLIIGHHEVRFAIIRAERYLSRFWSIFFDPLLGSLRSNFQTHRLRRLRQWKFSPLGTLHSPVWVPQKISKCPLKRHPSARMRPRNGGIFWSIFVMPSA